MIKNNTSVINLFKNTAAEKFSDCFYFKMDPSITVGYNPDFPLRNKGTVQSLNKFLKLTEEGKTDLIYFSKKHPDSNIVLLKHKERSKLALLMSGGGYTCVVTSAESLPVGMKLYEKGFSIALLNYASGKVGLLNEPYEDLVEAVLYLYKNSDKLNIDMENFILGGFSAGGHLASLYPLNNFSDEKKLPRPGLMLLGYPVITMCKYGHSITRRFLLGDNPSEENILKYSSEKHVDSDYPPTFIWHCARDVEVDSRNSIIFAEKLKKHNVPFELVLYDSNMHGLGLASHTIAKSWFNKMLKFYSKCTLKEG